ncbi:MAG: peptidoglycan-binding protein [Candidatus Peregrinibacteria bacterium]|nr:peptidoglycan-binding protein [Candidatus Peregrinibacteria bacterium]
MFSLRFSWSRAIYGWMIISILALLPFEPRPMAQASELYPVVRTVTISAYYSPCEGQSYYVTGSYDGDIRLNGRGTNGADGTEVYPGMIAAPSTYPFGTKISIPGIGMTTVHDRGGAIVQAGERGESYDRLDVWMGWCEDGLYQALNWGRKTLDVTIYGVDNSMDEVIYLEVAAYTESIIKNVVMAPQLFESDIWYLTTGEDVEKLQYYLKELGYYYGEISGYYGEETRQAVFDFQLANEVVSSWDDFGAGHTGVNTRKMLDLVVSRLREDEEVQELTKYQSGLLVLDDYPDLNKTRTTFSKDLSLGSVGADVEHLQEELIEMGYLRITPTGYYGEVTEHAVFKFQQKRGILSLSTDPGAGIFGPTTRSHLNSIIESRTTQMSYIAYNRSEGTEIAAENPQVDEAINTVDTVVTLVDGTFTRTMSLGDRGADVKELQSLLKQFGYFSGSFLTEFYGEQTKAAVSAFQLANGLIISDQDSSSGAVNEVTLNLLNSLF